MSGGCKNICEKLNHTAKEREEVIRGLEERVEDGKIAIHGLKRKLLLSIRRRT
jgi:hypothetical protein